MAMGKDSFAPNNTIRTVEGSEDGQTGKGSASTGNTPGPKGHETVGTDSGTDAATGKGSASTAGSPAGPRGASSQVAQPGSSGSHPQQ